MNEGAGVERLAAIYKVGKSTSSRWLISARKRLVDETRARLLDRLRLSNREYDSVVAAIRSGIHVSLARLLEP